MRKGRLRVLLGAAPGVGKTVAMLEEGNRLRDEGRDVVVALVETHGRPGTKVLLDGMEVLPRRLLVHRGVDLGELDLDATLARRPEVALVDELAHTNAPGSRNQKRWEDVEELLDAGIDVVSTLNIQHIDSLNDVVEEITGVPQRETIPDEVLRGADQIEVIDLAPQSLRDRLAAGQVYPAERIDAALSNYFRLGNLTALRELALLWLADEVDSALNSYRSLHGIEDPWEARERVVVALTGGPEGDTLLRRGARIAARSSGGELIAVHVVSEDGMRGSNPAVLAEQRALVAKLGGSYHQVVGEDVPTALVDFARGVNATQLVIGASRRGRWETLISGPGIGATVVRESGAIDVHLVTHSEAARPLILPRLSSALTRQRRIAGFAVALVGGPLLTWLLMLLRAEGNITSDVLAYQVLVVLVALVGGIWPALFAAIMSGLSLNYFFIDPLYTVTISEPRNILALGLYSVVAALVSFVVDRAARHSLIARRAAAESEVLVTVAGSVLRGQDAIQAILDRMRESLRLTGVRLVADGDEVASSGAQEGAPTVIPVDEASQLQLFGSDLKASDRRILRALTAQLEAGIEHNALTETAREMEPLAASERIRSALLAALGHDLRRPLASAIGAVGGLRSAGPELAQSDRDELLATAEESLGSLASLINDLLDVSKLQAGALAIEPVPVDPVDVILPALAETGLGPERVELDLDPDTLRCLADPALLQRVVANLLFNAARFTPTDRRIRVTTSSFAGRTEVRVIDHGPGIEDDRFETIFLPFQRVGDTDNSTGLGLGLALSKGFVEAMNGTLSPEHTPGGGLTMVISLEAVAEEAEEALP